MTTEKPQAPPASAPSVGGLLGRLQAICTALRQLDEDTRACEGVSCLNWSGEATRHLLAPIIQDPLVAAAQLAAHADPKFQVTVHGPRTDDVRIRAIAQLRVIVELLEQHPDELAGVAVYETTHEGRVSVHITATVKAQGLNG
jgi:hypothetical protein